MSANRANVYWHLHNMIPAPAADSIVRVIFKTEDGILLCYGTSAISVLEAETANTYAPGCVYIRVLAAGSSKVYVNVAAADVVADFESVDTTAA